MTPDEILAEHALARRLTVSDVARLARAGVPNSAVARCWWTDPTAIGRERVVFDGRGRFEFERHTADTGVNAWTLMLFDEAGEPVDIFGWRPGAWGLWLGRAALIGAEQVFQPRLLAPGIAVHRDIWGWLGADRVGLVVLQPRRAFATLQAASPLEVAPADKAAFARSLAAALPKLIVRRRAA